VLTAASLGRVSSADSARWRDFVRAAQRIARPFARLNRHAPPAAGQRTARDMWRTLQFGREARALGRLDLARLARWASMSIADILDEWFYSDLLKASIAAHAVFGNFAGPRSGSTGAMLLQRLAEDPSPVGGGVTVRGGPGALADALSKRATEAGARILTGCRVVRITTRDGRVTGVLLENGDELRARVVISAVDHRQTFLQLTEAEDLTPTFLDRVRNFRARGVTAKINLALSALPDFPAVQGDPMPLRGRLLIAPGLDYVERAFDAAKYGDLSSDPWLEMAIPSAVDQTLAPQGGHVMSIYSHFAPRHLRAGPWSQQRDSLYQSVMRVLRAHAPAIDSLIVSSEVLTPEDLEVTWGLSVGHIFHGESTLDQWWITRPQLGWARYRGPIGGLYLAGASAHPGGGLTGRSGFLAAKAVLEDLASSKDR